MSKKSLISKFVSLTLASCFVFATISSPSLVYASEQETVELTTKDFESGTVETETIPVDESSIESDAYIPEEQQPSTVPYTVFPPDERYHIPSSLMTIFPYSASVYIQAYYENGDIYRGTGWLFGPNDVATAGHVLCEGGELPTSVRCYFGANGSSLSGVTYYTATDISVPQGYIESETASLDYGFISLDVNVGNSRGYYGWTTLCNENDTAMILGYPGEKDYELWEGVKDIVDTDANFIYYNTDTTGGQSGSPVYNTITQKVMGIHTNGNNSLTYNSGVKITRQISTIMQNRQND